MKRAPLLALLLALGCPSSDETPPSLTVANFNAGLAAGYVDYMDQRQPLIGPALAALAADVVCLEEVWTQASADAILAATKDAYPHSYREVTKGDDATGGPSCTTVESDPLKTCAQTNCGTVEPQNLATCVLANCKTEFGQVSSTCSTCIVANIGKALEEILTTCTTAAGSTYTYEGRNGVLLLSKYPLSGTEYLRLDSYVIVRVVLHAIVATPDIGAVDVFCTHLTADLGADVKYAGKAASWEAENAAQVATLIGWVAQKAGTSGPFAVVLGDFNAGPAKGADIAAAFGPGYHQMTAAGWKDPYADDPATPCTWCASNPLVRDGPNQILDHAMVVERGAAPGYTSTRVLDQAVMLTVENAAKESRLSDHYGIQVTIEPAQM